ncbi:MAG: histidine kinase [Holophagaceae bacterium]|nr:histidine kinase [Holophagaceae bacterium]
MKAAAIASLTRRQLESPTTRWILLAFGGVFTIIKLGGYAVLKWNHPAAWASGILTPFLIAFSYGIASQWPWFWTGDDRLRAPWLRGILQAVLFTTFLILVLVSVDYGLLRLAGIREVPMEGSNINLSFVRALKVNLIFGMPMMTIVGALVMLGQITRMEKDEAETRAKEAQWVLLRGQLSPHVLFNSLNGLAELVRQDPIAAEQGILDLSALYRSLLDHGSRPLAPMKDEKALVERFLAVEQMRLGDRLKVSWSWTDTLDNLQAPPFMLQPLVENALKHGIAPNPEGGEIRIELTPDLYGFSLRVSNTGKPLPLVPGNGIGLRNLEARLKLSFGEEAAFRLASEGPWTMAEIRLRIEGTGGRS